jgi:hypothetical protein
MESGSEVARGWAATANGLVRRILFGVMNVFKI